MVYTCRIIFQEPWRQYNNLLLRLMREGLIKLPEIQDNFVKTIHNIQVILSAVSGRIILNIQVKLSSISK